MEADLSRVFLERRPLGCPWKAEPGLSRQSGPTSAVPEPPQEMAPKGAQGKGARGRERGARARI